jgi:amidohydrolase
VTPDTTTHAAKKSAREHVGQLRDKLVALSHRIHAHPEIGFEEEKASLWLQEMLTDAGFAVQPGACGMPTAFIARAGRGPLHVAVCAEYDALPGIGHGCGHNLIAAMAAGAGAALARVADDIGLTVSVLGTPAEEVGDASGKILMLERGGFYGVHAAMMVHPAPFEMMKMNVIAASMFDVKYTGKEAHAAAFPEMGINAADALTVAQVSIGLLRQHLRQGDRIHGITTHGGDAPNVVPAHTRARYIVRGETLADLEELRPKVLRCFEAGALATGSTLEIVGGTKPYAEMRDDRELAELYASNARALGRTFQDREPMANKLAGSTDMGNVSHVIPSIHPMIGLGCYPAANHHPDFTAFCATDTADRAVCDGAIAMAWTAIDAALDETVRARLIARAGAPPKA